MMTVLDIETLAIDDAASYVESVAAPANYKDPAKIAAYIEEAQRAQSEKAALYPWTARIIAMGSCDEGDEAPRVATANSEAAEATLLRDFWGRIMDTKRNVSPLVTFNGLAFDLPVLMARSRLLGVRCPELSLDRYRSPHPDLLQILTFRGVIPARSLTWFARRFGLNTDDAFSGKEIAGLYADGNWDAIRAHVTSDVTLTRQLAERLGVVKMRQTVA